MLKRGIHTVSVSGDTAVVIDVGDEVEDLNHLSITFSKSKQNKTSFLSTLTTRIKQFDFGMSHFGFKKIH